MRRWGLIWMLGACDVASEDELPQDTAALDADGDGAYADVDCDDADATIHPTAVEVVGDGVDQDCDGLERCPADRDGDGHGGPEVLEVPAAAGCARAPGVARAADDCDDDDPTLGAPRVWFADRDGDGHGDPASTVTSCVGAAGWSERGDDCDDRDREVHPGAVEAVADRVDQDCDGHDRCWVDGDGDGVGGPDTAQADGLACTPGTTADPGDCDDADPSVGRRAWHPDRDGDGLGAADVVVYACTKPAGHVVDGRDCDDANADLPVLLAPDDDGDGHGDPARAVLACVALPTFTAVLDDCDDSRASVRPTASETCNGADDDCDGLVDALDPDLVGGRTAWRDGDSDGWGTGAPTTVCALGPRQADRAGDCDDAEPTVHPDAVETCDDRVDQDCAPAWASGCSLPGEVEVTDGHPTVLAPAVRWTLPPDGMTELPYGGAIAGADLDGDGRPELVIGAGGTPLSARVGGFTVATGWDLLAGTLHAEQVRLQRADADLDSLAASLAVHDGVLVAGAPWARQARGGALAVPLGDPTGLQVRVAPEGAPGWFGKVLAAYPTTDDRGPWAVGTDGAVPHPSLPEDWAATGVRWFDLGAPQVEGGIAEDGVRVHHVAVGPSLVGTDAPDVVIGWSTPSGDAGVTLLDGPPPELSGISLRTPPDTVPHQVWRFAVPRPDSRITAILSPDLTGDAHADLVVGVACATGTCPRSDRLWIVRGDPDRHEEGVFDLPQVPVGTELVTFTTGRLVPWALAAAGDVDGDGHADLIVGHGTHEGTGLAALLYGPVPAGAFGITEVSSAVPGTRLVAPGVDTALYGAAVAGLGDVDGDGLDDVAVGAPLEERPTSVDGVVRLGAVYVVFGRGD